MKITFISSGKTVIKISESRQNCRSTNKMETDLPEIQNSNSNDSSFCFDDNLPFKGSSLTGNTMTTANLVSKNKQLLSENTKLKETIKDLRARLELLESKYKQNSSSLSDEIQNAKNETAEAKKNHINSVKNLESKLDEKTKLNSKLQKNNQELKSQIDSFLHSIELRSKKQVSSLSEASNLYDDLLSISESASDKIKNLESENSSLIDQLDETTHLIKDKEIETSKLKKKLKKAAKQLSQNQIDPDEFQKLNELHEMQMKDAQSIITEQNERIDQMKKQINATNDYTNDKPNSNQIPKDFSNYISNDIYETNIHVLQEKLQTTEQLLNDKDEAISSLHDTIDDLKEKCTDYEQQLQEANFTIASQNDSYKQLKEKMKQSKQTIQQLRNDLASKETELAEHDTTFHELQLKINELEAAKQQSLNLNQMRINNEQTNFPKSKESVLQYKETIKLYENRICELDKLFEHQSQEISELYTQRKSVISKLIQFDNVLTKTEAIDQELTKANKILADENKFLKNEIKIKQDNEKNAFNKAYDECLELIPRDAAFSLQLTDSNNISNNGEYYGSILKDFVQALNLSHERSMKEAQSEIKSCNPDEFIKANKALLEHLQNSCKIIKSFANSSTFSNNNGIGFNISSNNYNDVNNDIDSNPRASLLAECARLDKFIQDQKLNLPIDEFRPSIFEPRDMNDPQKIAQVFLDFVDPESFGKSPINELFTLFMCVCQVNHILFKNIDENKTVLQQATRASQNESAYFKQLSDLEKWKSHQSEMNDKLKPFLIDFVERENQERLPQNEFYDYNELVDKVLALYNQNGEYPVSSKSAELIQKIEELEAQVDILQKEIENSHKKQEDDRQLFCKKANKIVTQVQKRIEANNKQHEEEKAELSFQLDETKKLLDTSKASYESVLNKAQKKLQKREEIINSLRSENESLSQRTTTIQEMLDQSKSQADIDSDTIGNLQKQLDESKKQLELATNQKKLYKKKLGEIEENNMNILSSLRQRSEELSNKYENSISNLEKELNATRIELEQARKENAEIEQKKQDLSLLNAKLKMMERTATLKLTAANEALEREKQASEMRQKSIALALKAESDSISAEYDKIITQAIELFNKIMNNEFELSTTSNNLMYEKKSEINSILNEDNFDAEKENIFNENNIIDNNSNKECLQAIMNEVSDALDARKIQQFAIGDAMKLRRLLKMNPNESLIEAYRNLEEESYRIKQEAEAMKTKSINAETASLRVIRDNKKLERAAIELAEWTNWSKIMLRHISDVGTSSINQTAKETRYVLEEALLASISQKSIIKKVEILRFEKKLLLSQKPLVTKTNAQLRVREPVKSIVPLIISFNFTRRMQEISGMLPSKFNTQ